jgi:trehalose/maltose hydrolase-like predicted phosphorylase
MLRDDVVSFDRYDAEDEPRRESLLGLGNGLLFARAAAPEAAVATADPAHHYAGLYRAGHYNAVRRCVAGEAVRNTALVRLPDPFGLSFRAVDDGEWLAPERVQLLDYRHCLDLVGGIALREMRIRDDRHRITRLREWRLVSMDAPQLCALRWELAAQNWSGDVEWVSQIDGSVCNVKLPRNRAYEGRHIGALHRGGAGIRCVALAAATDDPPAVAAVALRLDASDAQQLGVHEDGHRLQQRWRSRCAPRHRVVVDKLIAVCTDEDVDADPRLRRSPLAMAVDTALAAPGFDRLRDAHSRSWRALWRTSESLPQAPPERHAWRFHAFHLLQTASPHTATRDLGLPARGWQESYYGQVFWDQLFSMPFFALHRPDIARGLLMYRARRLDTARARARRNGFAGAMFPWRSARSGEEETPPFQCNPLSGRWMADNTRRQWHIGAAIARDLLQYDYASGDRAFMIAHGLPMLLEIARFFASVAQLDPESGRYDIRGVVGPDEYHGSYPGAGRPGLDNNAYTNVMAAWTLRGALAQRQRLPPASWEALCRRCGLSDAALRHWETVSRRLRLCWSQDGDVLLQFQGFDRLQAPQPDMVRSREGKPRLDWVLEAQGDSADRWQVTKQADVLMLLYLFRPEELDALVHRLGYRPPAGWCRRTADFYLQRLTHESSLCKPACAGALAHLDPQRSWQYYEAALQTDLGPHASPGTHEGLHLGAMAATLDVLQRHYLGVEPQADGILLAPRPPPDLGDVAMDFQFRSGRYRVALQDRAVQLESDCANAEAVSVQTPDGGRRLQPGERLRLQCRSAASVAQNTCSAHRPADLLQSEAAGAGQGRR